MLKEIRAAKGELTPEDQPTSRLLFLIPTSPPPPPAIPAPALPQVSPPTPATPASPLPSPVPCQGPDSGDSPPSNPPSTSDPASGKNNEVVDQASIVTQQIAKLFCAAEMAASRSAKDVFPFHLKEVEAYHQLVTIGGVVEKRLDATQATPELPGRASLEALLAILRGAVGSPEIASQVRQLEQINVAFCEVRRILGQDGKPGEAIRGEVHHCLSALESAGVPAFAREEMGKRFQKYDRELYVAYDNKYVPRTNNNQEDFNNALMRYMRKGQGKMASWFHVEHQGAPAAYYQNLVRSPHVVGGTCIDCAEARAPLERTGTLNKLTVTEVMSHVNVEFWRKIHEKNEQSYEIHRWVRKVCKHGLDACLKELDEEWDEVISKWRSQKAVEK